MSGEPSSADLRARIMARIDAAPGQVWTPSDFSISGRVPPSTKCYRGSSPPSGYRRIDRGLYHRPNAMPDSTPSVTHHAIIEAVTRRDHARFVVDGMTAANDLGLTQVRPARIQVLVDARLKPSSWRIRRSSLKTVAPRRLFWAGRPGMRVVQALHWLQDELHDIAERKRVADTLLRYFADPESGAMIWSDLKNGLLHCRYGCRNSLRFAIFRLRTINRLFVSAISHYPTRGRAPWGLTMVTSVRARVSPTRSRRRLRS